MSKKNLIEKNRGKLTVQENAHNILSSKKKYFYPNKIDKTIEIVIVPKLADITANQQNVGIVLDEKLILKILSKRYSNVSITEINTENDLKKLALRKPDLVFSGVKYFYFLILPSLIKLIQTFFLSILWPSLHPQLSYLF